MRCLTVLEVGSLRSRSRLGWFFGQLRGIIHSRPHSWLLEVAGVYGHFWSVHALAWSLPSSSHGPCVCHCAQISPLYFFCKDTSHIELGPTPRTSFILNYLFKGLISPNTITVWSTGDWGFSIQICEDAIQPIVLELYFCCSFWEEMTSKNCFFVQWLQSFCENFSSG